MNNILQGSIVNEKQTATPAQQSLTYTNIFGHDVTIFNVIGPLHLQYSTEILKFGAMVHHIVMHIQGLKTKFRRQCCGSLPGTSYSPDLFSPFSYMRELN